MAHREAEGLLARILRHKTSQGRPGIDTAPGCAFGAVLQGHVEELEKSLAELRGRVNGLIFLVVGAVIVEIVLRFIR